jgi:hypothetical protein
VRLGLLCAWDVRYEGAPEPGPSPWRMGPAPEILFWLGLLSLTFAFVGDSDLPLGKAGGGMMTASLAGWVRSVRARFRKTAE